MKFEVKEDKSMRKHLLKNLSEEYNKNRSGIHVSDVVFCCRKSAFRKLMPKPYNNVQLSHFVLGKGMHVAIQYIDGGCAEQKLEWKGIESTVDMLNRNQMIPIELKTTRSYKTDIPSTYIRTLAYYCAMRDCKKGKLIVLHLNRYDDPFRFYQVTFSDLEEIKEELLDRAGNLDNAVKEEDPYLAYPVDEESKWQCKSCEYRKECKESDKKNV